MRSIYTYATLDVAYLPYAASAYSSPLQKRMEYGFYGALGIEESEH